MNAASRAELAAFLRRCRDRVRPEDVGLEAGRRRRTPGLRRQEIAQLAGMSVDYYIRLEQGRGPTPSRQMLAAIGRALRLSRDELAYLHQLAGAAPPSPGTVNADVAPAVLQLLDRFDDVPALVCDAKFDVLATNAMAVALLGDMSAGPPAERNVVWRHFTREQSRVRHEDDAFARESVADLRSVVARYPHDPGVHELVGRLLSASERFRRLWAEQDMQTSRSNHKIVEHPEVGRIDLDCTALHDPERDQWIIMYTAAPGTPAHQALQLLKVVGTQQLGPARDATATVGEVAGPGAAMPSLAGRAGKQADPPGAAR
jgi:transcriptional regulator with XRE-family HTH domain